MTWKSKKWKNCYLKSNSCRCSRCLGYLRVERRSIWIFDIHYSGELKGVPSEFLTFIIRGWKIIKKRIIAICGENWSQNEKRAFEKKSNSFLLIIFEQNLNLSSKIFPFLIFEFRTNSSILMKLGEISPFHVKNDLNLSHSISLIIFRKIWFFRKISFFNQKISEVKIIIQGSFFRCHVYFPIKCKINFIREFAEKWKKGLLQQQNSQ